MSEPAHVSAGPKFHVYYDQSAGGGYNVWPGDHDYFNRTDYAGIRVECVPGDADGRESLTFYYDLYAYVERDDGGDNQTVIQDDTWPVYTHDARPGDYPMSIPWKTEDLNLNDESLNIYFYGAMWESWYDPATNSTKWNGPVWTFDIYRNPWYLNTSHTLLRPELPGCLCCDKIY